MKFTTTAIAVFAGLVAAAPAPVPAQDNMVYVTLTYIAPDASYVINVPIAPNAGSPMTIASPLSFSHIQSNDPTGVATCYSYSVDNKETKLQGNAYVDIGPPAVQKTVVCEP